MWPHPINPTLKMQLPLPVGIRLSAGFVALRRGLRVSQSYLFGTQSRFYRVYAFTLTLCDGDLSPPIVIKHSFSQGGRVGK